MKQHHIGACLLLIVVVFFALVGVYAQGLQTTAKRDRLLATVGSNYLPELADINVVEWTFWMRDANTREGVSGVHITVVYTIMWVQFKDEAYTDSQGYATLESWQCDNTNVTAQQPSYKTRSQIINTFSSSPVNYITLDWTLTPIANPPTNVKITLWVQWDSQVKIITGEVKVDSLQYGFDCTSSSVEGRCEVIMWLSPNKLYSGTVSGAYIDPLRPMDRTTFAYSVQIQTENKDAEYYIDLLTGELHMGTPPNLPLSPTDLLSVFLAWIATYWMWVVAGTITLYALPHIASLARTVKGR
jgi:hypothetical protein